jgi:hypothetical protein
MAKYPCPTFSREIYLNHERFAAVILLKPWPRMHTPALAP